jgi:hypothetical protein
LYVVLGVVVLVAIIGLVLLNTSGNEPVPVPSFSPRPAAPQIATPVPTAEPTQVFEIFEGRDPFRPLVIASSGGGGASPGPGASPTPVPSGAPRRTPPPPRAGVQVEVLSVASDSSSATVRVGSTVHENARPGQTLSSDVVVDSIEGRCVNFHRGSERFRLCEGEQVLK